MEAVDGERGEREGVDPEYHGVQRRHWIAVILLAAACALAPLVTRRYGFVAFVALYAGCVIVWFASTCIRPSSALRAPSPRFAGRRVIWPSPRVSGERVAEGRVRGRGHRQIVLIAIALRATFL
ncbi:MAG TPA: hypothetical protein VF381_04095, partial [Thermoanaerobaculia bacterium]